MKRDFIVEIGVEEIPAGFIEQAIDGFHMLVTEKLRSANIGYEKSYFYSTPRRLTVYVTGVDETQKDQFEEVKGPPKKIAFSDIGRPTQAALGFIESNNAKLEDVTFKATPKGEYLYLNKVIKGVKSFELLPSIVTSALAALNFPKSMKWDISQLKFARPVRWILCLFGGDIVKLNFAGVESSNKTHSIRRMNISAEVASAGAYFDVVKKLGVTIDMGERCNMIISGLNSTAEKNGLKTIKDEELVREVANLTETPYAILCEFNAEFLKLPEKLLTSTMIKKQRYFPLYDQQSKLTNKFVVFSNGTPAQPDEVKYGNQKVIAARFADAEFYYKEDAKTTLEQKSEKLKTVLFQQKLGTVHQKASRIADLAKYLYSSLILKAPPSDEHKKNKLDTIGRCAMLCKADLTSEVVKEFTELQGYAGMVYAQNEGLPQEISTGIFEHYKPCFKGDTLPSNIEGQAVAVADKMDTIAGCFAIKMIPTGSGDPYALRRAALGIAEIAINSSFSFDFTAFAKYALGLYPKTLLDAEQCDVDKTASDISNFIKQRFETKLKELNIRYDVINAVLWNGVSNIYEDYRKTMSLSKARSEKEFMALALPFKRAVNITKGVASAPAVRPELFAVDAEKALYAKYQKVNADAGAAIDSNDYSLAFRHLSELNEPIDKFFAGVMVMDKNEDLKNNRIALLCAIKSLFLRLADISQLVIEE